MIDVRLTATNPEDSTLVPVPCNTRGELLTVAPVIEVIPNDLEIQGDLTVTGLINGSIGVGEPGPPGPEGPQGPEGPAGSIDLPPDPYEGAVLGWQDGQLAWIGQSVTLPPGTYGPFTYIPGNEELRIPQDASELVNGQQIYMSDAEGNQANVTFATDTISSAGLIPTWNQSNEWSSYGRSFSSAQWKSVFNNTGGTVENNPARDIEWICSPANLAFSKIQVSGRGEGVITYELNGATMTHNLPRQAGEAAVFELEEGKVGTLNSIVMKMWHSSSPTAFGRVFVDDKLLVDIGVPGDPGLGTKLTFPTANNFDKFQVGDVVQDPYVIINIDSESEPPTITTDGGTWGAEGNGPTNLSTDWCGEGSVFLAADQAILLRENNKEWVDDFYVTAPAQQIAVRKVVQNSRKVLKK